MHSTSFPVRRRALVLGVLGGSALSLSPLAWADQVGLANIQAVLFPVLSHANAFHGEDLDRVYPLIQRQVLPGKNMHG